MYQLCPSEILQVTSHPNPYDQTPHHPNPPGETKYYGVNMKNNLHFFLP